MVVFCWYLSLVNGSWTHILHFLCLDSVRSKWLDSFRAGWDPLIPATIPAIEVNKHILSILIHHLSLHPLSWSIPNIDPLSNLQLPSLQPIWEGVIDEVEIQAFDELINCMLVLLQYLKRLLFFYSEAVGALLQLSVLLGLVVLLTVEIRSVNLSTFQRGMMGYFWWYFVGNQLYDIPLLNTVISQGLLWIQHEPTIQ